MEQQKFRHKQRVVIVMYPSTFEEFQEAVAAGYQVSTTPEQRAEWGLVAADQLPSLDPEEAIELLFAEPGDPILDAYDPEMEPSPWGADGPMRKLVEGYEARKRSAADQPDDTVEARIPNAVTLQVPWSIVADQGDQGDGSPDAVAPA